MQVVKSLTKTYDFVTLPVYRKFGRDNSGKGSHVQGIRKNNNGAWSRADEDDHAPAFDDYETLAHLTIGSNDKYPHRNAFGYRKILKKENVPGKAYCMKMLANEYTWMTHREMSGRVHQLMKGLIGIGIKAKDRVSVFLDTRIVSLIEVAAIFSMKADGRDEKGRGGRRFRS